jgi:hypothetical protein
MSLHKTAASSGGGFILYADRIAQFRGGDGQVAQKPHNFIIAY